MSAQFWQEMYPKFQEMQAQWADNVAELIHITKKQDYSELTTAMLKHSQDSFAQQIALYQQTASQDQTAINTNFQNEVKQQPAFDWMKHYYLLVGQWTMGLLDTLNLDEEVRLRLRFFTQQFLDAMNPANFLMTNPEALLKAAETQGESLSTGMKHFLEDMQKGHVSITDESQFEVGVNVAVTEGAVVFENELIQILQYVPLTEEVHERPLLIVPPCVNKYYLMDLQKEHSMVRYLVEQGQRTFLISWKSITPELGHLRWDDYIEKGVLTAIDVVCAITKQKKVNTLGFCIGGTILSTALTVAKARGEDKVASLALMASMLDHCDQGDIRFFINDALVRTREARIAEGGVVNGAELAMAFSLLRANDLIWQPWVKNYLLGESPSAFDLLYWNADSTNLALPMHTFFLRNMYLENALTEPGKVVLCGVPIDLRTLTMPIYLFAAQQDHIVPWGSVYASRKLVGGKVRFVLGASGHVAGAINPVSKNKRNYWINEELNLNAEDWFNKAESRLGSWWQDLVMWQKEMMGKKIRATKKLGDAQYPIIEPAPGRYVKEKINTKDTV